MLDVFFLIMCTPAGWLIGRGMKVLDRGRSNGRFGLKEWAIATGMPGAMALIVRRPWLEEISVPVLVIGVVLMFVIAGWVSELFNGYE
ncbi:hypothetical protein [Roseateles sp. L2-2]|uniref:hypothetical protein n=1 Tax=Roseateles TaxID=93681 RepID=UPI003D365AE5